LIFGSIIGQVEGLSQFVVLPFQLTGDGLVVVQGLYGATETPKIFLKSEISQPGYSSLAIQCQVTLW
jgi:hypothetical protein